MPRLKRILTPAEAAHRRKNRLIAARNARAEAALVATDESERTVITALTEPRPRPRTRRPEHRRERMMNSARH